MWGAVLPPQHRCLTWTSCPFFEVCTLFHLFTKAQMRLLSFFITALSKNNHNKKRKPEKNSCGRRDISLNCGKHLHSLDPNLPAKRWGCVGRGVKISEQNQK